MKFLFNLIISFSILFGFQAKAQVSTNGLLGGNINTITTAVSFLMIAPDARAGALGDAGAASTPDASSQHWNPAKYPFAKNQFGFAVSYSPWLRALVNDINLAYLTGYYKFNEMNALSASLEYFSLGNITFTDQTGQSLGDYKPNEFSVDLAYSRKLTDNFSAAVALRYIYSNLTLGQNVNGQASHAGQSVAADIGLYYQKELRIKGLERSLLAFGLDISNMGNKINYTETTRRDNIPTNLRLGGNFTMDFDKYNSISLLLDLNKLLVPTPPIYKQDSNGLPAKDAEGNLIIASGMPNDVSVGSGIFQSFYDAPGGASEELREITYSAGAEYWYDKQFAIRAGYFHEDKTKGNRQFFTLGAGLRYNIFGLDFAYLIPTQQRNPLQNTLRFTLIFDFGANQKNN
ncbi:MAG: type IX secretion system outer membrane channel protein PorV [Bacteroidota bacterium]